MSMTSTHPLFFVVIVMGTISDCFEVGGIFSLQSDADRFRDDHLLNPSHRGVAVIRMMTMDEIKTELVKDRLMVLAESLDRLTKTVPNTNDNRPAPEGETR